MSIDTAKTILIVGATSGLGRALALALAALPSAPTVIGAGRRKARLEELASKGIDTLEFDVSLPIDQLKKNIDDLIAKYPTLDAVIFSSGVQYQQNFKKQQVNLEEISKEMHINYIAVVSTISLLTPHFLALSERGLPSWIIPITSGLALKPGPQVINYSASKAALHSFSDSLRIQLADTKINVLEIIPPLVESELHDDQGMTETLSKFWMPLDKYTPLTIEGLQRGDLHIAAGKAQAVWKTIEAAGLNGPFQ
ncbi:hypothetical protein HMN09_00607800 [Mycena chlorophos]|uniref:NAD(P)-binding protein n=1 Tax=Mycena chlorophos TaxID=658473 RepID=A0A8H6T4E0_MYCCL|nr:hypothetical protein HMN09_00607800 [Mycena chlorophos]